MQTRVNLFAKNLHVIWQYKYFGLQWQRVHIHIMACSFISPQRICKVKANACFGSVILCRWVYVSNPEDLYRNCLPVPEFNIIYEVCERRLCNQSLPIFIGSQGRQRRCTHREKKNLATRCVMLCHCAGKSKTDIVSVICPRYADIFVS